MTDDSEIPWHREQIAKNRVLLEELETENSAGGDVFPETDPNSTGSKLRSLNPS